MWTMFIIERLQKRGVLNLLDITKSLNTWILCRFKDQISHACGSQIDRALLFDLAFVDKLSEEANNHNGNVVQFSTESRFWFID